MLNFDIIGVWCGVCVGGEVDSLALKKPAYEIFVSYYA